MKTLAICFTAAFAFGLASLSFASAPAWRYAEDASTVYDNKTKLTWQKATNPTTEVWSSARSYCSNLGKTLGGTGWRLPTIRELLSIVDFTAQPPAIDPALPLSWAKTMWSATTAAADSNSAWTVSFSAGATTTYVKNTLLYVRCVR